MIRSKCLKSSTKIENTQITDHAVLKVEFHACKPHTPKSTIIRRMEPSLFVKQLKNKNWEWVTQHTAENVNADFEKFFAIINDSQEEAMR